MSFVLITSVAACVAIAVCVLLMLHKISVAGRHLPVTAEWIDELSVERYRPMLRLLDSRDLDFLKSQPGFTPSMAEKLRKQRCQVFRGYLRCLCADFSRICAAIKLLMLHSRRDRPDLAGILVRNQMLFAVGMYLPLGTTFAIFVGGVIRWITDKLRDRRGFNEWSLDEPTA